MLVKVKGYRTPVLNRPFCGLCPLPASMHSVLLCFTINQDDFRNIFCVIHFDPFARNSHLAYYSHSFAQRNIAQSTCHSAQAALGRQLSALTLSARVQYWLRFPILYSIVPLMYGAGHAGCTRTAAICAFVCLICSIVSAIAPICGCAHCCVAL
jgi:hypothetical protein